VARAAARKAGVALGFGLCVALIAAVTASTQPACTTHQCDGDFVRFEQGHMVDPDTWESTPLNARWLDFPGQRRWHIIIPEGRSRRIVSIEPYVSPAASPLTKGPKGETENYTLASGDLCEIEGGENGELLVHNDTCADFYVRVVVRFAREPAPALDAGRDAPISSDAAGDAAAQDTGAD
jgi:hypothetical protein